MSNIPAGLKYSKSHEWVRMEGAEAIIGITDHAQESLSDVVYVELPAVGAVFQTDAKFGVVESVKAASDLYTPLGGKIVGVNDELNNDPSLVNTDPYGKGWMLRLAPSNLAAEMAVLMDAAAYEAFAASEE
jgi:glycine cleavage system H protein